MPATDGSSDHAHRAILQDGDCAPFEIVNANGSSRVFLLCEHAGQAIPRFLGDMGLPASALARHIAFDIGAEALARRLSTLLDAPLVLQPYSRLVIDCNRPITAEDSIPAVSDTTLIPANSNVPEWQRQARQEQIHSAFHAAVNDLLDAHGKAHHTILVTIHSFTRRLMSDGVERLWELGLLFHRDHRFAQDLMASIRALHPQVAAAFNEPYVADDETDYAIPIHGEQRGIRHVLLEVRNDLIADEPGQEAWAAMLADAIADAAEKEEIEDVA